VIRIARWFSPRQEDKGFTLMELLIAMGLFAVVMTLVSGAMIVMYHDVGKQQGQSNDLDGLRKATDLLDFQVRYANAISQPGVGATGTATYVEWQTGNGGQPQTCTQWRLDSSTSLLQYRTWPVSLSTAPVPTAWVTELVGAQAIPGTAIFATSALAPGATVSPTPTATTTASATPSSSSTGHADLVIAFADKHGNPSTVTQTYLTLAAQNTSGTATSSAVCNQTLSTGVTRP
jgi:prepilin-type N-terminal cleavage/methylation domain-containing protein